MKPYLVSPFYHKCLCKCSRKCSVSISLSQVSLEDCLNVRTQESWQELLGSILFSELLQLRLAETMLDEWQNSWSKTIFSDFNEMDFSPSCRCRAETATTANGQESPKPETWAGTRKQWQQGRWYDQPIISDCHVCRGGVHSVKWEDDASACSGMVSCTHCCDGSLCDLNAIMSSLPQTTIRRSLVFVGLDGRSESTSIYAWWWSLWPICWRYNSEKEVICLIHCCCCCGSVTGTFCGEKHWMSGWPWDDEIETVSSRK
jgi:hypothetical protein